MPRLRRFLAQNQNAQGLRFARSLATWTIPFGSSLEKYFRYLKDYYPDYKIPSIITFIGNFGGPGN